MDRGKQEDRSLTNRKRYRILREREEGKRKRKLEELRYTTYKKLITTMNVNML